MSSSRLKGEDGVGGEKKRLEVGSLLVECPLLMFKGVCRRYRVHIMVPGDCVCLHLILPASTINHCVARLVVVDVGTTHVRHRGRDVTAACFFSFFLLSFPVTYPHVTDTMFECVCAKNSTWIPAAAHLHVE
ncbi:hypothetical protein, unlikely [Trypanosoma brucei gambiense DAL972]|uniref:Uncharacterized protein n=1 Tax=Trypanosoma brucei gambiense (strain MHOM/CI/86/DAL972) TaxID=679716 RepID=C9ZSL1_TRYB9|nr:hypothetical protein, unlikely [Trypanosoma brucei gambiense DAL972]CBH12395.1 hypothetical protein, unlikely [Trypanosoma brucei gambiense DAL972]|eukprot:XP_011774676.1 hypothetical protein, unlikely [Trypanosoma brucei gambiense DAL972]